MILNKAISMYFLYLEQMCGFSARTVKFHKRIISLWNLFLDKKNKAIGAVEPDDFLLYIQVRTQKVKNTS